MITNSGDHERSVTARWSREGLEVAVRHLIGPWVLILILAGNALAWTDVAGQLGDGAAGLLKATGGGSPGPVGRGRLALPRELTLPEHDNATLRRMRAEHGPNWLGPTQPLAAEIDGLWAWTLAGERVWRATIRAAAARALRVRFEDFSAQGSVWLYGDEWNGPPVGPYRQAGPHGDGSFWSKFVFSDTVTVEYVPDDAATASESVPFRVRSVARIVDEKFPIPSGQGKARGLQPRAIAGCHLDVSCYPGLQKRDQPSVARLYITNADATTTCTGFLINPKYRSDRHLLFLTAGHCIGTEEEAREASFLWNYQTETCYGNPDWRQWAESLAYTYGATLVVSKQDRYDDFALLTLSKADVRAVTGWWAEGWTPTALRTGDRVSSVGHPDGTHKRAAFGQVLRETWEGLSSLGFGTIQWRLGTTEPGSSGSPVFRRAGDDRRVVGIVSGSNGSGLDDESPWGPYCDAALRTSFNRFDHIYETIEPYLESEGRLSTQLELPDSPVTDDDHSDHPERATQLSVGSSTSGRIERAGDIDFFRVGASQRTAVRIFTSGTLDTVGSLRDNSGGVVSEDDDSGESLNFLIEATLERGTSYVQVGAFGGGTGVYTLHLEQAGRVADGVYQPLKGWLVSPGRVQFYLHGASSSLVGGCANWRVTINNNTYEFHASKWQWRSGPGGAWADIPGTTRVGRQICPYSPSQSGEYRMVGEISINGERGKYASENAMRWP